jgi:hypothetical protein
MCGISRAAARLQYHQAALKSTRDSCGDRADRIQMPLMEIELERKLREIRAEDRRFIVRLISAVTLAFSAAFTVGFAIGWCARASLVIVI